MKRLILAAIIFLALIGVSFAESPACKPSGLLSADAQVMTSTSDYNHCLCGVEVISAAADTTAILYDTASSTATGLELFYGFSPASSPPGGYPPNGTCIRVDYGIFVDLTGAGGSYIVWYR